jgi:hypothetical protein
VLSYSGESAEELGMSKVTWPSKVLSLCKKYGAPAKFAATTILSIVPGGPALSPLIETIFDTAQQAAQDDWEEKLSDRVQLTAENVSQLEKVLDILGGDLQYLMAQLSSLEHMPAMARQLLEIAQKNDDRAKAAIAKLDLIVQRFDRLEAQGQQVLQAQHNATLMIEEVLVLVRRLSGYKITEAQIQTTANAIAQKKHAFASKELLLDESAKSGTLVITDDDVDLLFQLKEHHRETIRKFYAPCCNRLTDRHYSEIWKLKELEVLDLSSCSIKNEYIYKLEQQGGLRGLLDVFLRSCRHLTGPGLEAFFEACPNIESLHLDGNKHLRDSSFTIPICERLYRLRTLSVLGCTQIDRARVVRIIQDELPKCQIIGP